MAISPFRRATFAPNSGNVNVSSAVERFDGIQEHAVIYNDLWANELGREVIGPCCNGGCPKGRMAGDSNGTSIHACKENKERLPEWLEGYLEAKLADPTDGGQARGPDWS